VKIHRDSTDLEAQTNRNGVFEDPSNLHGAFEDPTSWHAGAFEDPKNQHGVFVGQLEVQSVDSRGCSSRENLFACGRETKTKKERETLRETATERETERNRESQMLGMIDDGKRDCRRGGERESESKGRSCSVLVRDRIAKQRHLRSSFLKATEDFGKPRVKAMPSNQSCMFPYR